MARIIEAFAQFFDDNGDPLVNGWLKFNESGTNNTDKDTFADINETIPNTNPIQLDGAGRCPNVFGTGAYSVISYTDNAGSPGVQIQQFDPVGGDQSGGAFSDWDAITVYGSGDIVTVDGVVYYRSITSSNQNNEPSASPDQWEEVRLVGVWDQFVTYATGDVVMTQDGLLYRSLVDSNLNNTPNASPTSWTSVDNDLLTNTLTHNMASDADYTLSADENSNGRIVITDTSPVLTTARNILVADRKRIFFAQNDTLQTLTFKTVSGTGIAIQAGEAELLYTDGTNVISLNIASTYYVGDAIAAAISAIPDSTIQVFTASGTWNKPAGLKYARITVVGGGGGGGYSSTTTNGSGGGGGGGASIKYVAEATLGSSETVTIGGGGTGGSGGTPTGGTGGTSSFGAHCTATGGTGGQQAGAAGLGGNGTGGDANTYGGDGATAIGTGVQHGGIGGSSLLGGGGAGGWTPANGTGSGGNLYGGGGGGAIADTGPSPRNGGAGAAGIILVEEFY